MLLKDLTVIIENVIGDIENDDVRLTVGCMIYGYLANQDNKFDIRNKALAFKNLYLSQVIEKKTTNRTMGYINIEKIIENKKATRMSDLTMKDYDYIVFNFKKVELEQPYHPSLFSSNMFGLESFKNREEMLAFKHLNDSILKPIANYFKDIYLSDYNNLKIVKISETVTPAREFFFYYEDIPSDVVLGDLITGKILFDRFPSVIKLTKDAYIHIII